MPQPSRLLARRLVALPVRAVGLQHHTLGQQVQILDSTWTIYDPELAAGEISKLIEKYLARQCNAIQGPSIKLDLMKCLDLYHSKAAGRGARICGGLGLARVRGGHARTQGQVFEVLRVASRPL